MRAGSCAQARAHRLVRTGSCSSGIHVPLESMFPWSPCSSGIHVLLESMFFYHPKKKEPETPLGAAFLLVFTMLPALPVVGVHAHRLMRTGSCSSRIHVPLESTFSWNPRSSRTHALLESMLFWNPRSSSTLRKKEPETPPWRSVFACFHDVASTASCWGGCAQAHAHRLMRTGSCAQAHAPLGSMSFWKPCSSGIHVLLESMFFRNPCSSGIHVLPAP